MADKLIWGSAPTAGAAMPVGALQLEVYKLESDVDGFTVRVNAYTFQPPNQVEWGEGTVQGATAFTKDTDPAGEVPGKWHADHDYTKAISIDRLTVTGAGGVRRYARFVLGSPIRVSDPEDRDKTATGYQREARKRDLGDTRRSKVPPQGGMVN
jgi:hypothetical protein